MEWYKYADEETMVMVMTDSKQPQDVIKVLRKFANTLEAKILLAECAGE